jgi:hypothetical protein
MKTKDEIWMEDELDKLKSDKRLMCSPVCAEAYTKNDNKRIKKLKDEFKKKRRSIKRAEKTTWKKKVREFID